MINKWMAGRSQIFYSGTPKSSFVIWAVSAWPSFVCEHLSGSSAFINLDDWRAWLVLVQSVTFLKEAGYFNSASQRKGWVGNLFLTLPSVQFSWNRLSLAIVMWTLLDLFRQNSIFWPPKHIVLLRRSAFEINIFAFVLPLIMGTKEVLHSCFVPCIWLKFSENWTLGSAKTKLPPYFD